MLGYGDAWMLGCTFLTFQYEARRSRLLPSLSAQFQVVYGGWVLVGDELLRIWGHA